MSGTRIRQNYSDAISLAKEISASNGVLVSVRRSGDGNWTVTWKSNSEDARDEWLSEQASRYSGGGDTPDRGGYSSVFMAWSNPYRGMATTLASPQKDRSHSKSSESTRDAAVTQRLICYACSGDGGPGGRCPICGGNGIDPDWDAHRSTVI